MVNKVKVWCAIWSDACPQFYFWALVLQLELTVMVYMRAIPEADFPLYTESVSKIVPWFFALDKTHYFHIQDGCPSTYETWCPWNSTIPMSICCIFEGELCC